MEQTQISRDTAKKMEVAGYAIFIKDRDDGTTE